MPAKAGKLWCDNEAMYLWWNPIISPLTLLHYFFHIVLQILDYGAVFSDRLSEIENSASSFWREVDLYCIAHAAASGTSACGELTGCKVGCRDAHAASTSGNVSAQAIIFSFRIRKFLSFLFVELGGGGLGVFGSLEGGGRVFLRLVGNGF